MRPITCSIAARLSTPAEIIKLPGCAGPASGALSIRCDGDGDLKGGTAIGAGGAKGEGETDTEADATVSGAGTGRRDVAVTDGDLDFWKPRQNVIARSRGWEGEAYTYLKRP